MRHARSVLLWECCNKSARIRAACRTPSLGGGLWERSYKLCQQLRIVCPTRIAEAVAHGSAHGSLAIMSRRRGFRTAGKLICGGLVCIGSLTTASAGPSVVPAGPPPAPRTHGFMLYLSQPLGGGVGVGGPRFGLRIEQVRMTGNNGAPDAADPMQHRSIIGWQFGGLRASDMHLELGGRVTYDVKHGGFALQSSSRFPQPVSPRSVHVTNVALRGAKPLDAHAFKEHALSARAFLGGDMGESPHCCTRWPRPRSSN
jgi:hypothetical protein